jgi:uncharacterized protein (DUF58 family)
MKDEDRLSCTGSFCDAASYLLLIPYPSSFILLQPSVPAADTRFLQPEVVAQLDSMELRARLIVEGFITGLHKSPYHGFSVEFAEHRPYNSGDELRHVDWKVYGKTDRFYVKQYEEETNLRHHVVLDTSASMHYRHSAGITKLRYAAYLAAALHYLMVRQRDATGLIAFDEKVHTVMPPKATGGYLRALLARLDELTREQPRPRNGAGTRTGAAAALHEVAERITRRSLVVVLTDLFENVAAHEDLLKALQHLRYRGHEVLVFHILESETERAFRFPDQPMLFRDVETGEEITLQPAQLREHYAEAVQNFSDRFRRKCREFHIDFEELDTGQPYDVALMAYLNKRRKLF